jgi:hypothetical protein
MNELIKAATGTLWLPACALTRHVTRHLNRHVSRHVKRQIGAIQHKCLLSIMRLIETQRPPSVAGHQAVPNLVRAILRRVAAVFTSELTGC